MFYSSIFLWNTVLISLASFVIASHGLQSETLSSGLQRLGNGTELCNFDQSRLPGNLTFCGNSSLFSIWRPKARFIAPEGWMNDPQGGYYGQPARDQILITTPARFVPAFGWFDPCWLPVPSTTLYSEYLIISIQNDFLTFGTSVGQYIAVRCHLGRLRLLGR